MKSILDKDFRYTPAAQTSVDYLRERFKAIREEIERAKRVKEANVKPLIKIKRT